MYKAAQNGQLAGFDAAELAADFGGKLTEMMGGPESPSSPNQNNAELPPTSISGSGGPTSVGGGPPSPSSAQHRIQQQQQSQHPPHQQSQHDSQRQLNPHQLHQNNQQGSPPNSGLSVGALQGELQNMMSPRNDMMPHPHRDMHTPSRDMMSPRGDMMLHRDMLTSPPIPSPKDMAADAHYYHQRRNEYPVNMMHSNSSQWDPTGHYMYWHYGEMAAMHQINQQIMT